MMKAIAINGSPRKGGNTEILLNRVLSGLNEKGWETELVKIGGKVMRGCTACGGCRNNQNMKCVLTEDSFNDVFAKMVEADAIFIGSPTYFADVTAETKALIDRAGFVAMSNGNALKGKVGSAVVAVRRGGGIHVFDTINHLFHLSKMIVPGSTYWNFVYGLMPGDVNGDEEGLANMDHIASVTDWLARAVKPVIDSYPMGGGEA